MDILVFILQIRQRSSVLISQNEKQNVINDYMNLFKLKYSKFAGVQPHTLNKEQLILLKTNLYSVTDKADGDRFLLYVFKNTVYLLDNNIKNVIKTNININIHSTVVDGELIYKDDNDFDFYAFDILFFNGKDIRNLMLRDRLIKIQELQKLAPVIKMKKFIYENVFLGSKMIMSKINDNPYENDGLIFTPMNTTYNDSLILKWKPHTLNTIDFYSIKTTNNTWILYVQNENNQITPFNMVNDRLSQAIFDDKLIDSTTNESYKSNTVIEYKWDGKWIPLRTRWDKTINPKKHGNFKNVAINIWNNINNPITEQELFTYNEEN